MCTYFANRHPRFGGEVVYFFKLKIKVFCNIIKRTVSLLYL